MRCTQQHMARNHHQSKNYLCKAETQLIETTTVRNMLINDYKMLFVISVVPKGTRNSSARSSRIARIEQPKEGIHTTIS